MKSNKITLERFYSEFVKFVKGNEKRLTILDKGQKRIEVKLDKAVDFLDREVLADRKRIDKLETAVFKD